MFQVHLLKKKIVCLVHLIMIIKLRNEREIMYVNPDNTRWNGIVQLANIMI